MQGAEDGEAIPPDPQSGFQGEEKGRRGGPRGVSKPEAAPPDLKELHAKIGRQALEIDFLAARSPKRDCLSRKEMSDRNHKLPIKRQAELLSIGRSTVYYRPRPVSDQPFALRFWTLILTHRGTPKAGRRLFDKPVAERQEPRQRRAFRAVDDEVRERRRQADLWKQPNQSTRRNVIAGEDASSQGNALAVYRGLENSG